MFMKNGREYSFAKRVLIPCLAVGGSIFMMVAAVFAHGVKPFLTARMEGAFSLPVLFYLIVFTVIMIIGVLVNYKKKESL